MNVGNLKRALDLVPDAYEVHIEGQEIDLIELCERIKRTFKSQDFGMPDVEGVVNLVAEQQDEG